MCLFGSLIHMCSMSKDGKSKSIALLSVTQATHALPVHPTGPLPTRPAYPDWVEKGRFLPCSE